MVKYQLDSDAFLKAVKEGDISTLDLEKLEIFEKILPKEKEIENILIAA